MLNSILKFSLILLISCTLSNILIAQVNISLDRLEATYALAKTATFSKSAGNSGLATYPFYDDNNIQVSVSEAINDGDIAFTNTPVTELTISTNNPDAFYEIGETILFNVSSNVSGEVNYVIKYDQFADSLQAGSCLLYTSPSPRDRTRSRMPSSA